MPSFLRKLVSTVYKPNFITAKIDVNEELTFELKELILEEDLDYLLEDTINKMYLINVYSNSYIDLISNFNRKIDRSSLMAIDIASYFKGIDNSLVNSLKRIIPLLESNKISKQDESDLYEIINTIKGFLGRK